MKSHVSSRGSPQWCSDMNGPIRVTFFIDVVIRSLEQEKRSRSRGRNHLHRDVSSPRTTLFQHRVVVVVVLVVIALVPRSGKREGSSDYYMLQEPNTATVTGTHFKAEGEWFALLVAYLHVDKVMIS